jgi:hypothetical protein
MNLGKIIVEHHATGGDGLIHSAAKMPKWAGLREEHASDVK